MERVAELKSEPIVGRRYLVPCVHAKNTDGEYDWVPIMGDWHEDRKYIGFADEHVHPDWRFLSMNLADRLGFYKRSGGWLWARAIITVDAKNILERPKKCRRRMPVHDGTFQSEGKTKTIPWLPKLEAAYEGAKITACRTCPHKGMPLDSLPVEDGLIVCRGHGLAFSADTGELVKRCGGSA